MPKYLRKGLKWHGPLLVFECKDVAAVVRAEFAKGPEPTLDAAQKKMLKGPDFDAKVAGIAAQTMRDYGDDARWRRFHMALDEFLRKVHARSSITLFARSLIPEPGVDLQAELETVYKNGERIAALIGDMSPGDPARRFIEELVLSAATRPEDALKFVDCLPYAFGINEHAEASILLLRALKPEQRLAMWGEQPALTQINLMLRTDVLPTTLDTPGAETLFTKSFHKVLESFEDESIDDMAFRIQCAFAPVTRSANKALIEAFHDCLKARPDYVRYAKARFSQLVDYLEFDPQLKARFDAVINPPEA